MMLRTFSIKGKTRKIGYTKWFRTAPCLSRCLDSLCQRTMIVDCLKLNDEQKHAYMLLTYEPPERNILP